MKAEHDTLDEMTMQTLETISGCVITNCLEAVTDVPAFPEAEPREHSRDSYSVDLSTAPSVIQFFAKSGEKINEAVSCNLSLIYWSPENQNVLAVGA